MREPGWGLSGVRGPGRDIRHHLVQTPNCKYRRRCQRRRLTETGSVSLAQAMGRGTVDKGHEV